MTATGTITCIRCSKTMANFMEPAKGHQPNNGLAFKSYGHYGSIYFDPMDGSYIELSICDICLAEIDNLGMLFHSRPDSNRTDSGGET